MADEDQNDLQADEEAPNADDRDGAPHDGEPPDAPEGAASDEEDETPSADEEEPAGVSYRVASLANLSTIGELVVHYPERDVAFVLDGDAALRLMRIFATPGTEALQDRLDERSTARNIWMVLNTTTPLAMTWIPGVPSRPSHTTIDPVPMPEAAA